MITKFLLLWYLFIKTKIMENTVAKALIESYTYVEYRKRIEDLLKEGKASGNEQSEDLLKYSLLNETRMNRLDKTIIVTDEVKKALGELNRKYIWLVIAEGWCGDAAQVLPIVNKMSQETDNIELKIVFRDENPELMSHFQTNGRNAIPKLIIIDKATGGVKGNWGDRPKGARETIEKYKAMHGVVDEGGKAELQLWYLHDKGVTTQNELTNLMLDIE